MLPRLRRREAFWTTTEDDHRFVKVLRDHHPRGQSRVQEGDSEDSFDEGAGARYERNPRAVGKVPDPEEGGFGKEVEVMSRSRWQVRYIMGKAKLMLVEEENAMRRRELKELMELEQRMQSGEA